MSSSGSSGIPDKLRTGLLDEPAALDEGFQQRLVSMVLAMVNRAAESAAVFTKHAERKYVSPKDVHMALKYHAKTFFTDDSMNKLEEEMPEMEILMNEDDSDEDDKDNDLPSMEEVNEPWKVSECTCVCCQGMREVDCSWDGWLPSDPVEVFLKESVDKLNGLPLSSL